MNLISISISTLTALSFSQKDPSAPKPFIARENLNWHWRPTEMTLAELKKRITFKGIAPKTLSGGYHLSNIEALWIPAIELRGSPRIPPGQVVHLRYTSSNDLIDVIEARHFKPLPFMQVWWAFNSQCFVVCPRIFGKRNWNDCLGPNADFKLITKNNTIDILYKVEKEFLASPTIGRAR